jgi:non-specific protein-tyrosine kinase
VSANLAAAFAQADYETVLISADLRRSTINEVFGKHEGRPGLTGVVMSAPSMPVPTNGHQNGEATNGTEVPIMDALIKTPILKLSLLPSGTTPPNPAELLGSKRMGFVLATYAAFADIVIIDTPPLLPVTDAAVLAAKCDGVVLVTAVNETRRDAVERAKVILEGTGARLLGSVINKSPTSGSGSYYYAGYYESGDEMMQGSRRRGHKKNRKGADTPPAPEASETSELSQEVSS